MTMNPAKPFGISEQRVGDELYVYAADGETLTVLNGVAMLIWSMCDGGHAVDDMVHVLRDIFPDMDADLLRRDVQECLDALESDTGILPVS